MCYSPKIQLSLCEGKGNRWLEWKDKILFTCTRAHTQAAVHTHSHTNTCMMQTHTVRLVTSFDSICIMRGKSREVTSDTQIISYNVRQITSSLYWYVSTIRPQHDTVFWECAEYLSSHFDMIWHIYPRANEKETSFESLEKLCTLFPVIRILSHFYCSSAYVLKTMKSKRIMCRIWKK